MNQRTINVVAIVFVVIVGVGIGGAMLWQRLHPSPAPGASMGAEIRFSGPPPEPPPGVMAPRPLSASAPQGESRKAKGNPPANPSADDSKDQP